MFGILINIYGIVLIVLATAWAIWDLIKDDRKEI